MLIALWIINGLLSLVFLVTGIMKIARPRPALVTSGMAWAVDFSSPLIKAIGVIEIVGAIGLVLPLATRMAPILAPIAAVGLAIVMIGAAVVHLRRQEPPVPIVLAVGAVVSAIFGFITLR